MIENSTMRAAAQVIAKSRDLVSEGGQLTRDLYWDPKFQWEDHVIVPEKLFEALADAMDDYDSLCDLLDMDETEADFGRGCRRDILRGVGR